MAPGGSGQGEVARASERAQRAGWAPDGFLRQGSEVKPGSWTELLKDRESPKWDSFSWLTVRALFESVNDLLAKRKPEIVDERRARWMAAQRGRGGGSANLIFAPPSRNPDPERSFLLVGDTGEQDASQYALAPYFVHAAQSGGPGGDPPVEFMAIVSDVIYPAGDVNEYVNGFYVPYRDFHRPIYAIPGNHDWYDGLEGFMYHFCGAEPLPAERFRETEVRPASRLARLLWRGAEAPERDRLSRWRDSRPWGRDATKAVQPAPYFALDLGDLLLVAIDTGVTGAIDDEQGRWLVRVSGQVKKQKVLLTGKPIYVDGDYRPGEIAWKPSKREREDSPPFETVDDVVRHGPFGYVAAIGGDVHNYQRYRVELEERRTVQYIVSGGGGAYLSPTHRIPPIAGEAEDGGFRCYPRRGDSLAYTARRAGPRMFNGVQLAAASFVAAASVLLWGLPLDTTGSLSLVTAFVPLAVAILVAFGAGKLKKRRGKGKSDPARPRMRHVLVGAGLLTVFLLALTSWGVAVIAGEDDLLADPRFWGGVGVALLVPVAIVAAILLAHDLRGSIPASVPQLALLGAFAAAIAIVVEPGSVHAAPPWFVTASLATLFVGTGMLVLSAARARRLGPEGPVWGRMLSDLLVFAAPMALAVSLALNTDGERFLLFGAALAAAGAYTYAFSLALGTHRPPGPDGDELMAKRFADASRILGVLAWVTVAVILLQMIGDGWVAAAAIGSAATLTMAVIVVLLIALAFGTTLKRPWFPLVLAIALLLSRLLALPLTILATAVVFAGVAISLLVVVFLCVKALRKGRINAIWAQARIESLLDGGDGEDAAPRPSKKEISLFSLLYPFRWEQQRAQGAKQTGALAQTIAKLVAELSDSDEPPFFKHFLRVDVRPLEVDGRGRDRELRIRCYGVTGYAREEESPPVEDEVLIQFRSAERFAAGTPGPDA
ncbi:MAG TPA: hypothetical protein VF259_04960 [Solirubrobacterales bacterium]